MSSKIIAHLINSAKFAYVAYDSMNFNNNLVSLILLTDCVLRELWGKLFKLSYSKKKVVSTHMNCSISRYIFVEKRRLNSLLRLSIMSFCCYSSVRVLFLVSRGSILVSIYIYYASNKTNACP